MPRIDELLGMAKIELVGIETAHLDAECLLAFVLDKQRSYLRAYPEHELEQTISNTYLRLVGRRAAGEPLAYLTGKRDFWSLELAVTPDTLIPRPDTELLVETALSLLPRFSHQAIKIIDLGTGSGAIALALASECKTCQITATDLSVAALNVAKDNAQQLGLDNIEFVHSNWFSAFNTQRFDIIISNPPYIRDDDPHLAAPELHHEPLFALTSGKDGLDAIRQLTQQANDFLQQNGVLLIEHGYDQAKAVRELFIDNAFQKVETKQDLAGNDRLCIGFSQ